MNFLKQKSITLLSIFIVLGVTVTIIACNSKFPPKAPIVGTYGDSLWKIDHFIPNDQAIQFINNYRLNKESILTGRYSNKSLLFNSETFNLRDIATLLAVKGSIGLRINIGMDANNQLRLVLIGVDKDGKELTSDHIGHINDPERSTRTGVGGTDIPMTPGKDYVETGQRE